jgi:hypothetical protein
MPLRNFLVMMNELTRENCQELPVDHNMKQMQETANLHMRCDIQSVKKWVCECDDCQQIRKLEGMQKTLEVRPLVRKIEELEEQLHHLPEGPEAEAAWQQYFKLYDELAAVMAK